MSVRSFRRRGILGEALFNYLALLGWTPAGDARELLTRDEIVREFDIHDVSRAAAVFDQDKLEWLNGVYIRRLPLDEFAELALPFVVEAGLATGEELRARWAWFAQVMAQVQERVRLLGEVPLAVDFFFLDAVPPDGKAARKLLTPPVRPFLTGVAAALNAGPWEVQAIEQAVRGILAETGLGAKQALQPLRLLVSGRTVSPPLFDMIYLVGRERTLARLDRWLST
jgi:glutamyl/glutaminyl-tRNA synthetase